MQRGRISTEAVRAIMDHMQALEEADELTLRLPIELGEAFSALPIGGDDPLATDPLALHGIAETIGITKKDVLKWIQSLLNETYLVRKNWYNGWAERFERDGEADADYAITWFQQTHGKQFTK